MKAAKVRLLIRVRRSDGKDAYVDPAWNRNRTLREGYAIVDGKQEHHPEGVYYLRFKRDLGRRRDCVGKRADLALVALRNVEHDLQAQALGRVVAQAPQLDGSLQVTSTPITVKEAVVIYTAEVRAHRGSKTISSCDHILGEFEKTVAGKRIDSIDRTDLLAHMVVLRGRGLADRTVFNHIARINSLLRANGRMNVLAAADWPRYDEKEVMAYHPEQLPALFTACSSNERLLFEFFLGTGLREQEVMFLTWANIDFRNKLVSVYSKPEWGFRVKDKEERSVPIPDSLVDALMVLKRVSTSQLLFPSATGKPDGHFLRRLQRIAFRAGLNCGECVGKNGAECSDGPTCSEWGLHKFRKTFATMHSEANVPVRTIQAWLGHARLETTLAYIAVADLRSEKTRTQVNTTFRGLLHGVA